MQLRAIKYSFLIITIMATFVSCGKNQTEEVKDAITSANIYLGRKECQPAIDLLENLGRQNKNSYYLKALSSAYACRAGYSTITFFGNDIAKTATPAPLGGMTTYSSSLVNVVGALSSDSKFADLQKAIDILLYAGGIGATTEPTSIERAKYFEGGHAGDINAQLAFMMLVQTGKLLKVYANTNAAGVKGAGGAGNNCFTDYSTTPPAIQTYVTTVLPGACHSVSSSHAQLATGVITRRTRLCQGVVLLNSILEVLPSVLISAGGGDLNDIASVTQEMSDLKADLVTAYPSIGPTAIVMSQTNCENDAAITLDTLASYYAVVFEGLVQ